MKQQLSINEFDDSDLSIGSYNVYCHGYDRLSTLDTIIDMNLDILLLQETNINWENTIKNNTKITQLYEYIQYYNDKWREGGSILLSKYSINSTEFIDRYDKWWYGTVKFAVNMPNINRKLIIYSIHLVAPYPPINGIFCVYCSKNGKSKNEYRLKEMKHILTCESHNNSNNSNDNNDIILFMGDFNCRTGKCHEYIKNELNMTSIWNNNTCNNILCCCKHYPYSWRGMFCGCCCFAPKLFDHIYYNDNDLQLTKSFVYTNGESDHYPIISLFNII